MARSRLCAAPWQKISTSSSIKRVEDYRALTDKAEEKNALDKEIAAKAITDKDQLAKKIAARDALEKEITELSKISPFYTPERFKEIALSDHAARFIKEDPRSHTRIRWDRLLLESAYPKEIAKSIGGVFPDLEIHTPSNEDSQRAFQEYLGDAQRRLDHDRRLPNEQKQIKIGEDVRVVENKVQVSGQVAVMAINGLLTKIIFDKNPDHEFYVEEGKFPTGLDVSAFDSLRRHHEDQSPAAAGADRGHREEGP